MTFKTFIIILILQKKKGRQESLVLSQCLLFYLKDDEIGGGRVEVLHHQTLFKQIFRVPHSGEQIVPQGVLRLPSAVDDGLQEERELRHKLGHGGQQRVWDGLSRRGLLLQNHVHHELQDVREVRQRRAGLRQHQRLLAQIPHQQLAQDVMEVDLRRALHRAEREERLQRLGGRGGVSAVEERGFVRGAQDEGVLEQNGQRVDVDVEGQHDPAGQKGMRFTVIPGEERKPHLHPRLAAGQPQRLRQVALFTVVATGGPDVLHTLSQNHGRTEGGLSTHTHTRS